MTLLSNPSNSFLKLNTKIKSNFVRQGIQNFSKLYCPKALIEMSYKVSYYSPRGKSEYE